MLSVILTILKIIGLLILGILGLILLVVLAVLLVPIRYQADGAMADKKPQGKARISWLLRFVCVRIRFGDDGLHYLVKICGFSVLDSDKPKIEKATKPKGAKKPKTVQKPKTNIEKTKKTSPNAKSAVNAKKTGQNKPQTTEAPVQSVENPKPTSSEVLERETGQTDTSTIGATRVSIDDQKACDSVAGKITKDRSDAGQKQLNPTPENTSAKKTEEIPSPESDEKKSLSEKLQDLNTKKENILQKIREIKAKVDEVLAYLQSPQGKKLTVFLKKKLFRLLRHLKPKALQVHGRIGLKNPATTGQILGIAYMLYPLYEENIQLQGEFEEEVIEGDFYIKGRIRLGTLLLIALQVIINKEVRMWIKKATGGKRK